jgi:hypothetical protein
MYTRSAIRHSATFALILASASCSSSSSSPDAGAVATCTSPGEATPGPADTHCANAGPDGGALVVAVTLACDAVLPAADAGADDGGGASACEYGPTEYGHEADDDDCKYHLKWSSTPICDEPGNVTFTVVVTRKSDGSPLTGAGINTEVFSSTPGDPTASTYCDDNGGVLGPNSGAIFTEGPPGTYVGPIAFMPIAADAGAPGAWTVRFHLFEKCTDAPNAPHGHCAFHVTAP